jgi:hypothetical protein
MDSCSHCDKLKETIQIMTPNDLSEAIQIVRDNLENRVIVEDSYWPPQYVKIPMRPFEQISTSGTWDDYVDYYFRCSICGRLFRLVAETNHGRGGRWGPVNESLKGGRSDSGQMPMPNPQLRQNTPNNCCTGAAELVFS